MKNIFFLLLFFFASSAWAQSPQLVWDSIKSNTTPIVLPAFTKQYETPFKQPLADYGWEDGLQISPDGLNLYALYSPSDFFSWSTFFISNQQLPLCSLFGNTMYLRPYANTYGVDLVTNPFGCDSNVANIDIIYSHRNSVKDSFITWQSSGIARPILQEGGPAPLFSETDSSALDLFMFTADGDIWMIQNTTVNPAGINTATRLPTPINPDSNEFNADNAFLARINGDTIILVYEKYTDPSIRSFRYALSTDLGNSWSSPQSITTVNNSLGHIEHPSLYKDSLNHWWLYFSIDYTYISKARQTIEGNWDSWSTPENILHKGNAVSIGEPTVTNSGDISFSLAYENNVLNDSTDLYDLDPWLLPHRATTSIIDNVNDKQFDLKIYPNPFSTSTTLETNITLKNATLNVYNLYGQRLKQMDNITGNTLTFYRDNLTSGVYFIRLIHDNKVITSNKIVIIDE